VRPQRFVAHGERNLQFAIVAGVEQEEGRRLARRRHAGPVEAWQRLHAFRPVNVGRSAACHEAGVDLDRPGRAGQRLGDGILPARFSA
jgi:hypothetical protein